MVMLTPPLDLSMSVLQTALKNRALFAERSVKSNQLDT